VPGACYQRIILTTEIIKRRKRCKDDHEHWTEKMGEFHESICLGLRLWQRWHVTPCSPLKVNLHFGGTYRLYLQYRRVSQRKKLAWSRQQAELCLLHSTLEKLAICSSEMAADFDRTIRRYISKDRTLNLSGLGKTTKYIIRRKCCVSDSNRVLTEQRSVTAVA
jgi:hypothetical protein